MSLDDREYYREEMRRRLGFGPNPWEVEAAKRLQKRVEPAPVRIGEIDIVVGRPASKGWLIAAACIGCTLLGYLAGFALHLL
jgi:hypothetical protein